MIQLGLMYPPFLTSTLTSKGYAHILERTSIMISSKKVLISHELHSMASFLTALTPVMEEHTKLIDCLSEPSSQLIHH